MKLKIFLVAVIALFGFQQPCSAQPKNKSYNFTRGLEEMNKGNMGEAMEFLTKEIKDNPKNGYAYLPLAAVQVEEDEIDDAMKTINIALKKLPKKDKRALSKAHYLRGELYAFIGDTTNYFIDLTQALNLDNENEEAYKSLGQTYYEISRLEESDEIYQRWLSFNPASYIAHLGLGRNAYETEQYDKALKFINTAIRLDSSSSKPYTFRGKIYMYTNRYQEAIDDFIQALSIDRDVSAAAAMYSMDDDQTRLIVTKLKSKAISDPYEATWWFIMANICQGKKKYSEAIEYYTKALEIYDYPGFKESIADCYNGMGDHNSALQTINEILPEDPENTDWLLTKGIALGESGNTDMAVEVFSKMIELEPEETSGYLRRAHYNTHEDRIDEALEDYEMVIMLNPNHWNALLSRAKLLARKGQTEQAFEIYRKITELDTVPSSQSTAMFALLALGEKEKAIDFMNKVIESASTDPGCYYDCACFYTLLGDMEKGLGYLRTALEKGFCRFYHIRKDYDLTELRKLPEFEALMKEFESSTSTTIKLEAPEQEIVNVSERVEIPFTPESGCYSVKCSINNLPLTFLFDTGASTVSISQVEANFMLKNGYLNRNDILGSGRFIDANGDISEDTVINLREVDFGGLKLNNVKASVVRNQKAPLLLGQTVLSRLGSIEIDNPGKRLIINHSK